MPVSWSYIEDELIVADYFNMLIDELTGKPYSKTEHRTKLTPLLKNRSAGSIEFKHQNISAILISLGQPYIRGYRPRYNYQKMLEEKVIEFLAQNTGIELYFQRFTEREINTLETKIDFQNILVEPPIIETAAEPISLYQRKPMKINYLEREQASKKLGDYGEEIVLEYEQWNHAKSGKEKLAGQIVWISKEEGDGVGFDILSKNLNGSDKYIEVKTTRLGKKTPFFFSNNELDFSIKKSQDYHLYRLFSADLNAKMFIKSGALNEICNSLPIMYKGFF